MSTDPGHEEPLPESRTERHGLPRRDPVVRDRVAEADRERRQLAPRDAAADETHPVDPRFDDRDATYSAADRPDDGYVADDRALVDREWEAFGGLKMGSAFFGWLSAMGMAVLLTALLAAIGAAVGLGTGTTIDDVTAQATQDPTAIGWAGLVGLLVVLFVSYFAGGYVAGRMARFDGARQGVGVWLWALLAAVVVAVLGLVAGDRFNLLEQVNGFPRIPVGEGDLTTVGIVAAVLAALVPLLAAVLGGRTGMRFHRRVDEVALDR